MEKNNKIKWCCRQKYGISLVEPNKNLAGGFILKAEKWLEDINNAKYKESKISFAYYTAYDSIYAILQVIGVKCEIHSCTFEFIRVFLKKYFNEDEVKFMEKSHDARKDSTYYVDREVKDEFAKEMIKKAPGMMIKCRSIIEKITEKEINLIREELKKAMK